jgi:hypothetical protein
MPNIEFDIKFDEVRELGLHMTKLYGNNLPKQYILLMAVARVVHGLQLEACGRDLAEKELVEKCRGLCDQAAIEMSQDVLEDMKRSEVKVCQSCQN